MSCKKISFAVVLAIFLCAFTGCTQEDNAVVGENREETICEIDSDVKAYLKSLNVTKSRLIKFPGYDDIKKECFISEENLEVSVTDEEIEQFVEDISLEQYVEKNGMTLDEFYQNCYEMSEKYIKKVLFVGCFADELEISLSDETGEKSVEEKYSVLESRVAGKFIR